MLSDQTIMVRTKTNESDSDHIKRLSAFDEKQCSEIQNLLVRNATLAEELAKTGGVHNNSQSEQRVSRGSDRVHGKGKS